MHLLTIICSAMIFCLSSSFDQQSIQDSFILSGLSLYPSAKLYADDYFTLSLTATYINDLVTSSQVHFEDIPSDWLNLNQNIGIPEYTQKDGQIYQLKLSAVMPNSLNVYRFEAILEINRLIITLSIVDLKMVSPSDNTLSKNSIKNSSDSQIINIPYSLQEESPSQLNKIYIYPQIIPDIFLSSSQQPHLNVSSLQLQLEKQVLALLKSESQNAKKQAQKYENVLRRLKMQKFKISNQLFTDIEKYDSLCSSDLVVSNIISEYLSEEGINSKNKSSIVQQLEESISQRQQIINSKQNQLQYINSTKNSLSSQIDIPLQVGEFTNLSQILQSTHQCSNKVYQLNQQIFKKQIKVKERQVELDQKIKNIEVSDIISEKKDNVIESLSIIRHTIEKLEKELNEARILEKSLTKIYDEWGGGQSLEQEVQKLALLLENQKNTISTIIASRNRQAINCRRYEADLYRVQLAIFSSNDPNYQQLKQYFKQVDDQNKAIRQKDEQMKMIEEQIAQQNNKLRSLQLQFSKKYAEEKLDNNLCLSYWDIKQNENRQFQKIDRVISILETQTQKYQQKYLSLQSKKALYSSASTPEYQKMSMQGFILDSQKYLEAFHKQQINFNSTSIDQTNSSQQIDLQCLDQEQSSLEEYGTLQQIFNSAIVVKTQAGRLNTLSITPCTSISSTLNPDTVSNHQLLKVGSNVYFSGIEIYSLLSNSIVSAHNILILPN